MTATPAPLHTQPRLLALDGVRGVAILLVLLVHAARVPEGAQMPGVLSATDYIASNVLAYGWAGVDLFFVLSGYLITGILLRQRDDPHYFRNFYARRVLRIFPLYYAVVLVRLFVVPGMEHPTWEAVACLTFWSNLWYGSLPGDAASDPVLGVTWSLAIEEQFYLLWPLLVYVTSRRVLASICWALIVGALGLRIAMSLGDAHWLKLWLYTPCRVDTLAVGALVAVVGAERVPWPRWIALLAAAELGVMVLPYGTGAFEPRMQVAGYTLHAVLGGAVVVLALRNGLLARLLEARVLRAFGRYSYAIYLLHIPIVEGLGRLLLRHDAPLPLRPLAEATGHYLPATLAFAAICIGVAFLAGLLSWHALEKHVLSLRRLFVPRGRAR
ncbi:MAG: acyltransferase family protein [Planctomycetota bacterium]